MTAYEVNLTRGYLLQHTPARSGQGYAAAVIDVAQDLLLRYLTDEDLLSLVVFKGGTALRKVYAGAGGRFSTDLDFAVESCQDDPTAVAKLLTEAIDGAELGPFRYEVTVRRGKATIVYHGDLAPTPSGPLQSKIDVGPPPWLTPTERAWVELPIHGRYGGPLPLLPVVDLAENVAEKIARLNRRSPARDAYDLVWVARTPGLGLDHALIRRLVVLKAWVDHHGLVAGHATWAAPLATCRPFDVNRWLQPRTEDDFDDDDIGLLTAPPPDLADLGVDLSRLYQWLSDLDDDERRVAQCRPQDRNMVLRMLAELPGGRLTTPR